MSSFDTFGIQMEMEVSVVVEWEGNFVLVPTTGPPTTEMTWIIGEAVVEWLGNCVLRYSNCYKLCSSDTGK